MDNKMRKIFACCILSILLINIPITAAAGVYMFSNMTVGEGLTQGTVNVMFQDSNGYVWIGTNDGLNRYNGYELKVFNRSVNDKNSLISGYIMSIAEDNNKNLWVGTVDGISRINLDDYSITNYNHENSSLFKGRIADIKTDDDGLVFIASESGLQYFDEENNDFVSAYSDDGNKIKSINCYDGFIYGISKGRIFKYDKNLGETEYIFSEEIESVYKNDTITALYIKDDIIVFGTNSQGIYKYNMNSKEVESIGMYCSRGGEGKCHPVKKVFVDSYNNIFVGTENGLISYDSSGHKWIYTYNSFDKYTLVNDNVLSIMQDKSGMIWIGTEAGLSIFEPDYAVDYYYNNNNDNDTIMGNIIHGLYEASNNRLWVGTNGQGISVMNKNKKDYDFFSTETANKLTNNVIADITGNEEKIFAATENGVNIIDRTTMKVDYIIDGLKSVKCNALYLDNNKLYVSTSKGLNIINIEDYSISNLDEVFASLNLESYSASAMFKDSEGILWIGLSLNGGLIKYNEASGESRLYTYDEGENSISDNTIYCINEDSKGNMWFGTSMGLNKLDKESEKFTVYSTDDGISNNTIYSVVFDNRDRVWISNNSGIERLEILDDEITVKGYAKNNEFNRNSYVKLRSGWIAFGSSNGLFIVNPNHNTDEAYKPELKFDSFKVNGIDVADYDQRVLNFKDSSIYLKLFTTYYKNAESAKFYYKINNESSDWTLMQGNEITFSKLAAGKYDISFKALSSNGVYSEEKTISFEVLPPVWRSNFAIFIYVLILIAIINSIYNKIKRMDRSLADKSTQLDEQMEQKNKLLEKVLDLERRKNNYLVNMSHELRTPLNIIYSVQQLILDLNTRGPLSQSEVEKYMDMSGRNIHRLLKIINDLIDSSKIDSGNFDLIIEEKDIIYVIEEAVLSFKSLVDEKGINLVFDTELEECVMEFDENAIERCIFNIINNAIKFTDEGGEILVDIYDLNDKIKIEISDNGCGIPEENRNDIFDRFSQVINSKRELTGGSGNGLGLTITKRIIELHGGDIFVDSEVGRGSTFVILLPKVKKN